MSKIKIKIGSAEFEAEGEPKDIQAQYAAFLELVKAANAATPAAEDKKEKVPGTEITGDKAQDEILKKVFNIDTSGLISLKVLPQGEKRVSDAILLLLYGYSKVGAQERVYAVTLARAARKSGVTFDRMDRAVEPLSALIGTAGLKRGTTYTINNAGLREAEKLLPTLL